MTIYDRIKLVIRWLIGNKVSNNQEGIGAILGYTNKSSFSQVLNGKVDLPKDFIERLCRLNDDLNINWIETGMGEMLKSETKKDEAQLVANPEYMNIPFVPISAHAGFLNGYGDAVYIEELTTVPVIVDKEYKGRYFVFEIKGDSMDDNSRYAICNKDHILVREVKKDLWKSKLHIDDWFFLIAHKEYGIVVKQITKHNMETGDIVCHSLNPDPAYEDFPLNLNDVTALFNVVEIVRRNARR